MVCLIFLVTSPIGLGYAGGFLAHLISEILPYSAHEVSTELMLILSLISLLGFYYSKSNAGLKINSVLSTFFICNSVLFFSSEYKSMPEYFYPDRYIIGVFVSLIILGILTRLKMKETGTNKVDSQ